MQVWLNQQFVAVEVGEPQLYGNAYVCGVQLPGRADGVQVAMDAYATAQQYGHLRDLTVLAARSAAAAIQRPGTALVPVTNAELQALWSLAQQGQTEKLAAQVVTLLLAAWHRQKPLDVFSIAASLKRSVWDVLGALKLLHGYGAIVYGQGVPDPADLTPQAGRVSVKLASEPPNVAQLVAFTDALARSVDSLPR
jgi:hypothetical protein